MFLNTNTRIFFLIFQIKYCALWSEVNITVIFAPLNFALLLCSHRWTRTDLSVESHVLLSGHIDIFWKTDDVYVSVLKLLIKNTKTCINPYWIHFIIILNCIYYWFMATIHFIFKFKKINRFLILIVFKSRTWNFMCDYVWNANGWYNYVLSTCSYNSKNKEVPAALLLQRLWLIFLVIFGA